MTTEKFESLLDRCCEILTAEARSAGFRSSKHFEDRVREVLSDLTADDASIEIDFNSPAQAFPDIAMGEYGVEVKYTTADTWRSIANSVLETQRVEGVRYIYVVFGKMGGVPEVRWGEYEASVVHVRTSHVPRFEVEIAQDSETARESLFQQMGIHYDDFRKLDMSEKMKYIREYGTFKALDAVSMHVPKGSIYGFVGKNGAGKTTLIRLICGLQTATSGEYTLYGRKNTDKEIDKSRRRMGAVVETPSIYLDMTAEENLKEQYRILGLPSFDGLKELLKLVGLENTGNKKARNFSLGMRQRLGIAVALCGDPDFLVLDEPVNGLDPQGIIEMRKLILKLNREHQITVLISSHILDELSKLATHYGFIDNGHILKEISAKELDAACRKCVSVEVTNVKMLACVLDGMGVKYEILSDSHADIFAKVNISKLTLALAKKHCEVLSVQEYDESLENYFVGLIGGRKHE